MSRWISQDIGILELLYCFLLVESIELWTPLIGLLMILLFQYDNPRSRLSSLMKLSSINQLFKAFSGMLSTLRVETVVFNIFRKLVNELFFLSITQFKKILTINYNSRDIDILSQVIKKTSKLEQFKIKKYFHWNMTRDDQRNEMISSFLRFLYNNKIMKHSPQKFKTDELRRKQIETTLNQLHKLQSEIYELNIPVNPHSSPPVKKQIKQLTYLYENMTKPKEKNQLNIEKEDIEFAFKILEGKNDRTSSIDSRKLSSVMKSMFDTELQTALIKKGDSKPGPISAEEIYQFLNFNQFDDFDPKLETFKLMTNEQGKFSLKKYQQYSSLIGLPAINNEHLFLTALGLKNTEEVTYEKFKQILHKHA